MTRPPLSVRFADYIATSFNPHRNQCSIHNTKPYPNTNLNPNPNSDLYSNLKFCSNIMLSQNSAIPSFYPLFV